LLDVWRKEQDKLQVRDNALLTVALAVELGLSDAADSDEAGRLLLDKPLARGDVVATLIARRDAK